MKIEDQVCSIEQAKKLKGLGVSQDAYFSWVGDESHTVIDPGNEAKNIPMRFGKYVWVDTTGPINNQESDHRQDIALKIIASAFTVAELGVMLPNAFDTMRCSEGWNSYNDSDEGINYGQETEAIARAALLIYALENNHTTAEECNNRLSA